MDDCPVVVICSEDTVVSGKVGKEVNINMSWKEGAAERIALDFIFFAFVKVILYVFNANPSWIITVFILDSHAIPSLERY